MQAKGHQGRKGSSSSGPPCLWPCLLSHTAKGLQEHAQHAVSILPTAPFVLCKHAAIYRQFGLDPVQPGQSHSPSTRARKGHLPSVEESADLDTMASTAEPPATARDTGHCHLRPRQEESTKKQST